MYKFQVGQKVIFRQGPVAKEVNAPETIEATVYRRDNINGHPIYQIEWAPTGRASVPENQLTVVSGHRDTAAPLMKMEIL